jgi:hypothetical protein
MTLPKLRWFTALIPLLAACGQPEKPAPEKVPESAVVKRSFLSASSNFTGVTVDRTTGRRFVVSPTRGIYELLPDGTLTQRWDRNAGDDVLVPLFHDLAALDSNRFALIADNDGYVLELDSKKLQRRFCYLPGEVQDSQPTAWQRSLAVTYEPTRDLIYAQPRTFPSRAQTDSQSSQIASFDPVSGEDLSWKDLPDRNFAAGGMAMDGQDSALLGSGAQLLRYDLAQQKWERSWDLSTEGVQDIGGVAVDAASDTLLVLDATDNELVELKRAALR